MSRAAHIGRVATAAESSWNENSSTFGTPLPHVGEVDLSGLVHPKQATGVMQQYRNAGSQGILMPKGGQVTFNLHLTGHGSATSGAVTLTDVETLLGRFLGAAAVSASSGDTFTGGTAGTPTTTSASGFNPGAIGWAGVLGDGRGEGQAFVVSSHGSNNLVLRTNLNGAPNNGDVCYSGVTINTEETAANADVASNRFLLQSGNLAVAARGCFPMAAQFSGLGNGAVATIGLTYGVSDWDYVAPTFPDTAPTEYAHSSNTAGSFFMQDHGTATRAVKSIRDFVLNYTVGMAPIMGPGGRTEYQTVVGAVRTRDTIKVEYVTDADTATTSPTEYTAYLAATKKHILYSLSGHASGSRLAIYLSNLCYDETAPPQFNLDGLNRVRTFLTGYTNTSVTTSELTLSALRIGSG